MFSESLINTDFFHYSVGMFEVCWNVVETDSGSAAKLELIPISSTVQWVIRRYVGTL